MPPPALDTWTRAARDADLTLELPGGVPMFFRRIPAGEFLMGSRGYHPEEEPQHRVTITRDFYLGTFPVTQAQFGVCTRAEKIEHENHFKGERFIDHPAENLDWRQAVGFCAWLTRTKASEFARGSTFACLPTEAEWEYACRAGADNEYYNGDGEAALDEAGSYGEEWGKGSTHSVGRKQPNAFGLFDMHGNVWEWCHDVWDEAAYRKRAGGEPDPGWEQRANDYRAGVVGKKDDDRFRVVRGGSWFSAAFGCRSAFRLGWGPVFRFRNYGFRVCLVRGPAWIAARRRSPMEEADE